MATQYNTIQTHCTQSDEAVCFAIAMDGSSFLLTFFNWMWQNLFLKSIIPSMRTKKIHLQLIYAEVSSFLFHHFVSPPTPIGPPTLDLEVKLTATQHWMNHAHDRRRMDSQMLRQDQRTVMVDVLRRWHWLVTVVAAAVVVPDDRNFDVAGGTDTVVLKNGPSGLMELPLCCNSIEACRDCWDSSVDSSAGVVVQSASHWQLQCWNQRWSCCYWYYYWCSVGLDWQQRVQGGMAPVAVVPFAVLPLLGSSRGHYWYQYSYSMQREMEGTERGTYWYSWQPLPQAWPLPVLLPPSSYELPLRDWTSQGQPCIWASPAVPSQCADGVPLQWRSSTVHRVCWRSQYSSCWGACPWWPSFFPWRRRGMSSWVSLERGGSSWPSYKALARVQCIRSSLWGIAACPVRHAHSSKHALQRRVPSKAGRTSLIRPLPIITVQSRWKIRWRWVS